jgi:pentatricopeptide repeat protein
MNSLSDRLERLRRAGAAPLGRKPSEAPDRGNGAGGDRVPPGAGWQQAAEGVWERILEYPPVLPPRFDNPFILPEPVSSRDLVFYDLETTGLSGGAGNLAFLIGLGRQQPGGFVVTQLFLEDYPGESGLLARFRELTGEYLPQVSYNGRAFDSQVLKTRFLLNRMPAPVLPQVDLLYPARRLWKSVLPDLSLSTLETRVLGVVREDDLPGREAPEAWFEWLRNDARRIAGVFTHNAQDVVSMARLVGHMERLGSGDAGLPGTPPSAFGMARQWMLRNPELGRVWLAKGWQAGEPTCGRALAASYRRRGDWEKAMTIWKEMHEASGDIFSAVELAKIAEHRLKDPRTALKYLAGFDRLPLNDRETRDLRHRIWRLERKILRQPHLGTNIRRP